MVERNLAKVEVAGSSPVSRSFSLGVVPKWLREQSAKLLCIGSNPIDASRYYYFSMFYTYVLRSFKDKHLYVGYTTDVQKRLSKHNSGLTKSTKSRLPFELLFFEEFGSRSEAMLREKFFKTGKGKEYIDSKLLELSS